MNGWIEIDGKLMENWWKIDGFLGDLSYLLWMVYLVDVGWQPPIRIVGRDDPPFLLFESFSCKVPVTNKTVRTTSGYGSILINTIFSGMNIHLPAILMFTRGTRFWPTAIWIKETGLPVFHVGHVDQWEQHKSTAFRGSAAALLFSQTGRWFRGWALAHSPQTPSHPVVYCDGSSHMSKPMFKKNMNMTGWTPMTRHLYFHDLNRCEPLNHSGLTPLTPISDLHQLVAPPSALFAPPLVGKTPPHRLAAGL